MQVGRNRCPGFAKPGELSGMERRKLPPRRGGAHPRKHYTRPPDSRQNGFPVEIIQSLEGVGCGLTRSSNEESANEDPFAKHDVVVIQCEKLSSALGKAPNSSRNWTWRLKLAEEQEESPRSLARPHTRGMTGKRLMESCFSFAEETRSAVVPQNKRPPFIPVHPGSGQAWIS